MRSRVDSPRSRRFIGGAARSAELAGDLDAGRPAADDDEGQPLVPRRPGRWPARPPRRPAKMRSRSSTASAKRLQAERRRPATRRGRSRRSRRRRRRSGCRSRAARRDRGHRRLLDVEVGDLRHQRRVDVGLAPQVRCGSTRRTSPSEQAARGDLIEQRLEQVVVHPVDERHVDVARAGARCAAARPPKPPPTITTRRRSRAVGSGDTGGLLLAGAARSSARAGGRRPAARSPSRSAPG